MKQDNSEMFEALGYKRPTSKEIAALYQTKPEFKKPNVFKRIRGCIRLWVWGVCPECNHDAPELYDCQICRYYQELPRYKNEQTKEQKRNVWRSFLGGVANEP